MFRMDRQAMDTRYLRGEHLAGTWRRTDEPYDAWADQQPVRNAARELAEYRTTLRWPIQRPFSLSHRPPRRQLAVRHESIESVLVRRHSDANDTLGGV